MLGAVPQLTRAITGVSIDAAVGRQVPEGMSTLHGWRSAGLLSDVMILHLGNNGAFTSAHFDEIMAILSDVRLVVFVNVKIARSWEESTNAAIASGVARHESAVLVDWHAASAGRSELFSSDGIHLSPEGARLYSGLIASALAAHPAPTPTPAPTPSPTPPTATPTPTPPPTLTPTPPPTPSTTSSPLPTPTPVPSPSPSPEPP